MGYRCEVCKLPVPAGNARLVHTIYREVKFKRLIAPRCPAPAWNAIHDYPTRKEVAREIPVCQSCKNALDGGMTLANLLLLVACESRWVQAKPKEPKRLAVGRSADDKEIAKLQAQIAQLEGK